MRIRAALLPALCVIALGACGRGPRGAVTLPPVPVEGPERETRALAGSWQGEFVSRGGDRKGVIVFTFPPGRDTAYGHVVFTGRVPPSGVLTLARVNVGGTSVGGWLRSWRDPALGCPVDTWFEGTIRGDTLDGMYFSHPSDTAAAVRLGTWWAARGGR